MWAHYTMGIANIGIFQWRWNSKARSMGASRGLNVGVIAQDVAKQYPESVCCIDEYLMIDYSILPNKIIEAIKWHSNYLLHCLI